MARKKLNQKDEKVDKPKDGPLTAEEQYELEKNINAKMRIHELEAREKETNSELLARNYRIG